MTVEQFRKVLQAKPFLSFTMRLADGSRIHVPHPDFVLMHPDTPRSVVVATEDGTYTIIDLLLVSAIDVGNGRAHRKSRR